MPLADAPAAPAGLAPIQFFDLKSQQAHIRDRLEARWRTILDHGRYIQGPEVEEMEGKLVQFTGANDCVAVGSGTQALVMPLIALGYGHGDAVFIPAFTYNATANAVLLAGATPVFVDVDPATFNMDPADLERRIEAVKRQRNLRARAIIPVDLYGLPAHYAAIFKIAEAYNLAVVADSAQSFGGRQDGRWVGAIAPVTATSFYPSKALGCYGDGGAIFCADKAFAEVLRSIRWHGTDAARKDSVRVGINGRLDSIQCAVVTEKLALFEDELAKRRKVAAIYESRLAGKVGLHKPKAGSQSGYGLFTVTLERRDAVKERLAAEGVPTAIYYGKPLHKMEAFAAFAPAGGLANAERLADQVLSLPMHGYVSEEQAQFICDRLLAAVAG